MKKLFFAFTVCFSVLTAINASAQSGFSDVIKVNPSDVSKLLDAYGQPLFKGFGVGMNSGWANTAKTKKLLHFELRVDASAAFTPSSDKTYDVTKLGLSNNVGPANPNNTIAPTIGGERGTDGPVMNVYDNSHNKVSQFTLPSGKLPVVPSPQVQLTVGLIDNTDLTIRAMPSINFGSNVGSVSEIGFGLKHDLNQYIFGKAAKVVPFNLSVLLGYSSLHLNTDVDVQPDEGAKPENAAQPQDFSNQHIQGHFNSFIGEVIFSKQIAVFTPFVSVGYNTSSSNVALVGNYPVTTNAVLTQEFYTVYTNPVNLHETSISGMRADIGFQLNLGIRIFASASIAQYKSVNGGIGFGF